MGHQTHFEAHENSRCLSLKASSRLSASTGVGPGMCSVGQRAAYPTSTTSVYGVLIHQQLEAFNSCFFSLWVLCSKLAAHTAAAQDKPVGEAPGPEGEQQSSAVRLYYPARPVSCSILHPTTCVLYTGYDVAVLLSPNTVCKHGGSALQEVSFALDSKPRPHTPLQR